MEKRSSKKSNNDKEDDEEDRKPPAKEIQVKRRTRRGGANTTNSTFESSSNLSTDTASMSSWLSPVARLPSAGQQQGEVTPQLKKYDSTRKPPPSKTTHSTIQPILQSLQTTIILWLATMCLGISVFLYQILPNSAFSTLAAMVVSSGLFVPVLYNGIRDMIQELATSEQSTGLAGLLLSDTAYQTLTGVSLHEYLTNSTPNSDWRFLLLYFLPLSEEQLNRAMDRLTISHRRHLHQPGLLHWIVPNRNVLRYAVGPRGLANMTPRRRVVTPRLLEPAVVDDNDDDDSSFDLGLDISTDDLAGGATGRQVARRLGLTGGGEEEEPSTIVEESDEEEDEEELSPVNETDVLLDAMWDSAISTVWNPMVTAAGQMILPSLVSGLAVGSTLFFTAWWRRPSPRNATWTIALFGSTSVLALVGYQQRYIFAKSNGNDPKQQQKHKQEFPKKP